METVSGSVSVGGRIAYVPQQAWIMNASARDNILFGAPYNEDR
jgi:ABC-type multidrug transport system fused ATPase/permease subunit